MTIRKTTHMTAWKTTWTSRRTTTIRKWAEAPKGGSKRSRAAERSREEDDDADSWEEIALDDEAGYWGANRRVAGSANTTDGIDGGDDKNKTAVRCGGCSGICVQSSTRCRTTTLRSDPKRRKRRGFD
mmetsp:Transcript_15049/g.30044  ORF Transcript_15049/g.30044 Transcript_15049/m.30044 type:complete len:128 (+) Transcript_15049:560-943(+)